MDPGSGVPLPSAEGERRPRARHRRGACDLRQRQEQDPPPRRVW